VESVEASRVRPSGRFESDPDAGLGSGMFEKEAWFGSGWRGRSPSSEDSSNPDLCRRRGDETVDEVAEGNAEDWVEPRRSDDMMQSTNGMSSESPVARPLERDLIADELVNGRVCRSI
jgi:hypothetical protein